MMHITAAERATVIAALRTWQAALALSADGHPPNELFMTATANGRWAPLTHDDVEKLIARILVFNTLAA